MKRRKPQQRKTSKPLKPEGSQRHPSPGGGPGVSRISHSRSEVHSPAGARGKGAKFLSSFALTPGRVRFAFAAAILWDVIQVALSLFDDLPSYPAQGGDVLLALLLIAALGFHPLLLAALLFELVPNATVLPMWTACTAIIIALRKER